MGFLSSGRGISLGRFLGPFLLCLVAHFETASGQVPGSVTDFKSIDSSTMTVTLAWGYKEGDMVLEKYTIKVVEKGETHDNKCQSAYCTYVIANLDPCSEYNFEITPIFDIMPGHTEKTTGSTDGGVPGAPINLAVTGSDTGVVLTWSPPSESPECAKSYKVCSRLEGSVDETCTTTTETTATITEIENCSHYYFSVKALTPAGTEGEESIVDFVTGGGVPGPPSNLKIEKSGIDYIMVSYNDPLENANCAVEDAVMWETFEGASGIMKRNGICDPVCESTISPLPSCSNVSITVSFISSDDLQGEAAIVDGRTADTAPLPPASVSAEGTSTSDITVNWLGVPDNNCASNVEICWVEETTGDGDCVTAPFDKGDGSGSYALSDLIPCGRYEVSVAYASPSGLKSSPLMTIATTEDVEPGPVTNLVVTESDGHSLTYTFSSPSENPQCATTFKDHITDVTLSKRLLSDEEIHKDGLLACSDYLIEVSALSSKGLESSITSVEASTSSDTPSEVQNIEFLNISEDSVVVQWRKSHDNDRCIAYYTLTWTNGQSSDETEVTFETKVTPFQMTHQLTGLVAITTYDVTITAVMADGTSSLPATASFTTNMP